jgi:hypothetical protein
MPEPALVIGREHPGKRGDVGGGGEVEPAEAGPPAQSLEIDRASAGVPGRHFDPALGLLGPLVQVHAPEGILSTGQRDGDAMLARLQALSDEHFGYGPDEVTWSHVGRLEQYAELLKRITDSAFKEGEHAE